MDPLKSFQEACSIRKIASKFKEAKEFNTPEALKEYLRSHPKADKSKHRVKGLSEYNTKKPKAPKEEKEKSLSELMRENDMGKARKGPPKKKKEKKEESLGELMRRHTKKPKDSEE